MVINVSMLQITLPFPPQGGSTTCARATRSWSTRGPWRSWGCPVNWRGWMQPSCGATTARLTSWRGRLTGGALYRYRKNLRFFFFFRIFFLEFFFLFRFKKKICRHFFFFWGLNSKTYFIAGTAYWRYCQEWISRFLNGRIANELRQVNINGCF